MFIWSCPLGKAQGEPSGGTGFSQYATYQYATPFSSDSVLKPYDTCLQKALNDALRYVVKPQMTLLTDKWRVFVARAAKILGCVTQGALSF